MKREAVCVITFFLLCLQSCKDVFEKDISKDVVKMMAPPPSGVLMGEKVDFVWEEMEGAEKYRLVVVKPSFATIRNYICDTIVKNTYFRMSLDTGAYEWSVQAQNFAYESRRNIHSFTVVNHE